MKTLTVYFAHKMETRVNKTARALQKISKLCGVNLEILLPENFGPNLESKSLNKKLELANHIFQINKMLIKKSDLIIANVTKHEDGRDSGVMWECGYAYGLDIPVITYTNINSDNNKNIMILFSSFIHYSSVEELLNSWKLVLNLLKL